MIMNKVFFGHFMSHNIGSSSPKQVVKIYFFKKRRTLKRTVKINTLIQLTRNEKMKLKTIIGSFAKPLHFYIICI